jgi:hypothetical protein
MQWDSSCIPSRINASEMSRTARAYGDDRLAWTEHELRVNFSFTALRLVAFTDDGSDDSALMTPRITHFHDPENS